MEWIVSRPLCAWARFDTSAIPRKKREDFVRTAASRWAPFADPEHHVHWQGDSALVWAWSASGVRDLGAGADHRLPRRLLPESLLRGEPRDAGAELVALEEGIEGRIWRAQVLVANQWWPAVPDLGEWNAFLRGAGYPLVSGIPEPVAAQLGESAWDSPRANAWGDIARGHRPMLLAALGAVLAFAVALPGAMVMRLLVEIALVEREIAARTAEVGDVLQAREAAEAHVIRLEELARIRPPAGQLQLMAQVSALVPGSDWRILEWRMSSPGRLEVDLAMPRPDPAALVAAFAASRTFANVTAELGRGAEEVTVAADVARAQSTVAAAVP